MDEDFGAGVAAVGRVVAGVPVAELVAAVAVAGLGGHGQGGDGFGQGQGLCGVGGGGDGGGQDGEGDGREAAQDSFDHVPLIAALKGA
ncbi:hypothetical protein [Streptomyces sp. DT2A-34]|uniref:hypothetical protein n=1 Tax=Streptomyces sp. DT2A-34 TaxID=3051182 RepID=UPI003464BD9A